jgi:hypothetical protein
MADIDPSTIKPLDQTAAPTAVGAVAPSGFPAQAPQGTVPNQPVTQVTDNSGIDPSTITPIAQAQQTAKPAIPTGEMQAPSQPRNIGDMIKRWTDNVATDIKYGTDTTGIGTVLKKLGAHGVYTGSPEAVADIMASMPLGLLKVAGGMAGNLVGTPSWQNTKDIVGGGFQAATMPLAFMAPEGAEGVAKVGEEVGDLAANGAEAVGKGVKRVGAAFTDPRSIDREAIANSSMRGVQPRIQSGLRSMMKSLESEFGIEKPAGSAPEPPIERQSIGDAVKKTADAFNARAKSVYAALDKATGGQFQRFENELREVNDSLSKLVKTPDEASMDTEAALDARKAKIEEARDAAFDRAREAGVDPKLIEGARADFKRSQALYDLDFQINKVRTGARPSNIHLLPEDLARDPEMLHPERLQKRLDTMYDSGRLQEAVGDANADKLTADMSKHKVSVQQATRQAIQQAEKRQLTNSRIRTGVKTAAVAAGVGSGALGAVTHIFLPGQGVQPVQ